jgi:antitoxin component YwqK of YwqJK toxin-antitoxin module
MTESKFHQIRLTQPAYTSGRTVEWCFIAPLDEAFKISFKISAGKDVNSVIRDLQQDENVRTAYTYHKNKDGELDGSFEEFFDDGTIKQSGEYKNGKLDGTVKKWYTNGQLRRMETYKDGVLDGPYESYYTSGQLQQRGTIKDRKHVGDYEVWRGNGTLEAKGQFGNDGSRTGLWYDTLPPGLAWKFYKDDIVIADSYEEDRLKEKVIEIFSTDFPDTISIKPHDQRFPASPQP